MRDTCAICDDERWTIIGFGLKHGAQGLLVVSTHCNASYIDITVRHRNQAQIFLGHSLTAHRELGDCRAWSGFARLPTGVGIHFGIEHKDVDIASACKYVIEATITNVICPAITTD